MKEYVMLTTILFFMLSGIGIVKTFQEGEDNYIPVVALISLGTWGICLLMK